MSINDQIEKIISTDWAKSFKQSQSKKEYAMAIRLVLSGVQAYTIKPKKSKYWFLQIGDFSLEVAKKESDLIKLANELNLNLA